MSVVPCTPQPPVTRGVVVFDPAVFITKYPMFATVSAGSLQGYFNLATLQLNNTCGSLVCDANQRETLLDLLTAHITALFSGVNGVPPTGVVGRVAKATEGSVTAEIAWDATVQPSQAWFLQTPWGALYWQSTIKYRTMRYIPPPAGCNYGGGPFGRMFYPGGGRNGCC